MRLRLFSIEEINQEYTELEEQFKEQRKKLLLKLAEKQEEYAAKQNQFKQPGKGSESLTFENVRTLVCWRCFRGTSSRNTIPFQML